MIKLKLKKAIFKVGLIDNEESRLEFISQGKNKDCRDHDSLTPGVDIINNIETSNKDKEINKKHHTLQIGTTSKSKSKNKKNKVMIEDTHPIDFNNSN
jgi:hypothetical protein